MLALHYVFNKDINSIFSILWRRKMTILGGYSWEKMFAEWDVKLQAYYKEGGEVCGHAYWCNLSLDFDLFDTPIMYHVRAFSSYHEFFFLIKV